LGSTLYASASFGLDSLLSPRSHSVNAL
jgi:hypothetical protein